MNLPCQRLCQKKLNRRLWLIQITCLTCLIRRFYYGKVDRTKYVYLAKNSLFKVVNTSPPYTTGRGYAEYTYYLIVNYNGNRLARFIKRLTVQALQNLYWLFYNLPNKPGNEFTGQTYHPTVFPVNVVWVPFTLKSGMGLAYLMSGWDCVKANIFKVFCSLAELIANW